MERLIPFIEASVGGRPVKPDFYARLVSATITDAPGQDSDTCELTFDDEGNAVALPPAGSIITVRFGFRDAGSFKMGVFEVEKPKITLGEDGEFVILSGRSAAMGKATKEPASEHFDDTTIGGLVKELAGRNGYGSKVSPEFASVKLPYAARVDQSVADFLTRLADRHGALFAVKDGKFLFLARGTTAAVTIDRSMVSEAEFTVEPRPRFGKVEASWFDRVAGLKKKETHDTGLKGPVNRLRTVFATKAEATAAAKAEGDRLGRATGSGSITLAGMPELMADIPVRTTGFRAEANGLWRCTSATHTFSDTYTTSIELEAPEGGKT